MKLENHQKTGHKKYHRMKYLFFVLLLGMLSSCIQESSKKILYFAHNSPQSHPVHKGALKFQEVVAKVSGGKLSLKIFRLFQVNISNL